MKIRIYPNKGAVRAILERKLAAVSLELESYGAAIEELEKSQSVLVTDPFNSKRNALVMSRTNKESELSDVKDQLSLMDATLSTEVLVEIET